MYSRCRVYVSGIMGILLFPLPALAQQPIQGLPEQLVQCQSLLRVKQETPCRCDQVELLAAALLRRAEKSEEEAIQLKAQLAEMKKSSEKFREPAAQEDQK